MDMNEYKVKPNSHKYKEEQKESEKKVEKVVKHAVKTKKKNGMNKLADVFISEDAANVKSYVLMDVLVPTIKKALVDIVKDGIEMIVYGSTGTRKSTGSKVSYRNYYDSRRDDDRSYSARPRTRFDYDDLIFENRGEAEAVLDQMGEMIDRYGVVTVADMYDMADLSAPYTSNKYGWTNIRTADIIRVRDGYIIKLSKAMPID